MIHYLIQIIAFQALFLMVYDLFLKQETYFNWNRVYLMGTALLSFVLPFVQIPSIAKSAGNIAVFNLPAVFIGQEATPGAVPVIASNSVNWLNVLNVIWAVGIAVAALWFAVKLAKIFKYIRQGEKHRFKNFTLIQIANSSHAFSFLKTIFLGTQLSAKQRETVLQHEEVHVVEHHTLDQLFFELLRIVLWFNPMVYLYQARITSLHEFIADSKAAKQYGTQQYSQELLSQVFQTQDISFINPFFNHSLIKKRIIMLQKSKSGKSKFLKFVLLLPLLTMMVFYASCSQEVEQTQADQEANAQADVMTKIEELSEAIMAKGNLTDEEAKALQFLATPYKEGDKVYETVQDYLHETSVEKEMAFATVDKVPVYPGCEGTNDELRTCMSQKISELVAKQFNTKRASALGLIGRQRISVQFKIDVNGNIVDINARAPHPELEDEAKRVTALIPKLVPGQHEGKNVAVMYSLPIIFQIGE